MRGAKYLAFIGVCEWLDERVPIILMTCEVVVDARSDGPLFWAW